MQNNRSNPLLVFSRPLVIGSILLLLINDHLFKVVAPSWVTGKLSDAAGLFFFPFLIGVLLDRLPMKNWQHKRALAIGLSAVAFAAIKTIPAVNQVTVDLLRRLLGPTVQVVCDPSDLLALAVLPGVFVLWQRWLNQPERAAPGRLNYIILGLGTLACIATSPCPYWPSIRRLVVVDERLYAETQVSTAGTLGGIYALDLKKSAAEYIEHPDAPVSAALTQTHTLPLVQCDPAQPQQCYRIDGRARIEQSQDGGSTWRVSWQIPADRELFIQRFAKHEYCMKEPEVAIFDLIILPTPGGSMVVAAAGNEGLVILRPGGSWQRTAVGEAQAFRPTPLAAQNFNQAWETISAEFLIAAIAALLGYTAASTWGRSRFGLAAEKRVTYPRWALHPAWFVIAWLVSILLLIPAAEDSLYFRGLVVMAAACALVIMFLVLLTTVLSCKPGPARSAGWLTLLLCLALLIIPLLFFLLWAYGYITSYALALILALASTLPACGVLLRKLAQISRKERG